jgi:hypothetical protein
MLKTIGLLPDENRTGKECPEKINKLDDIGARIESSPRKFI